jgi:hypothetical protein
MTACENSRSRLGGSESRFNGHIAAKVQTHPVSSRIGMQKLTQNLEYTSKLKVCASKHPLAARRCGVHMK